VARLDIENIARRPYIRRLAYITVTYDTPTEKIEKAVEIIEDILKDHEGMDTDLPPKVYFDEFNSDLLKIEEIVQLFAPPPRLRQSVVENQTGASSRQPYPDHLNRC
jgi:MscS family membrane protein